MDYRFTADNYQFNATVGGGSRSTVTCSFSFDIGKEHGIFLSGSYMNWKDDRCKLSYKHTPDGLDVTRVLAERDDTELDVVRILDSGNAVRILDVEKI